MEWVNTFLRQTIQSRDMLVVCGLYMIPLAKRKGLWGRVPVGVICSLALSWVIPHGGPKYLIELLIAALFVWFCCDLSVPDAFYCAICGYASQHVAYAVYAIIASLVTTPGWDRPPKLSFPYLCVYLPVFLLSYLLFGRRLADGGRYNVDLRQTLFSSVCTLLVVWLLSSAAQTLSAGNVGVSIVCHLYGIFCCVSMLWGQVSRRMGYRLERELVVQQQLARQQREQYEITQETIELINRKCHDLKHQVAALRAQVSEEQRDAYLSEIEQSIQIYDSTLKTGSEVLDTVLTDKSLYCEANRISMTCMADGRRLSFMDSVDVYAIFGNALDNAIESVRTLTDPDKREIAVSVWAKSGLLLIQIENYFEGVELNFENGLPLTTKPQKGEHGFGMRSIRYTVEKYGGHMRVSTADQLFLLSISIPLP